MNIGFWACIVTVPVFALLALIFGIGKEKSTKLVSGFNMLPKWEQEKYDKAKIAMENRNVMIVFTAVMLCGAVFSLLFSPYAAIAAYAVWLILLFKDFHLDARKAYEKYKLK